MEIQYDRSFAYKQIIFLYFYFYTIIIDEKAFNIIEMQAIPNGSTVIVCIYKIVKTSIIGIIIYTARKNIFNSHNKDDT